MKSIGIGRLVSQKNLTAKIRYAKEYIHWLWIRFWMHVAGIRYCRRVYCSGGEAGVFDQFGVAQVSDQVFGDLTASPTCDFFVFYCLFNSP